MTMDDLQLLRDFRADLPPARPTARAAARGRLQRPSRAQAKRHLPRRAVLATATLAACAGVAVALVSGLDEGRVNPAPATAREALRKVATVAETASSPGVPRDDQYFYVASEGTNLAETYYGKTQHESFAYLSTKRREIWLSVDRAGALKQEQLDRRWVTPHDREQWIAAGRPRLEPDGGGPDHMEATHGYYLGSERLTGDQLRAYDPTPQELFDHLRANVGDRGNSPDGEVFVEIADALREAPQTPKLRATLYRALALVPGVQLLGAVRDRLGRDAVGVAYTEKANGIRQELLFDPQTAEILNEREVATKTLDGTGVPAGTVIGDVVYTKRAVTDTTERP